MEEWLDKVLSFLHLVINLKKEEHVNTKKIKTNTRKDKRNKHDTKAKERVDIVPKYPILDV
jgi:hypothetical protein